MKTTLPFFPFALQQRNGERSTVIFRNYFVRILCMFAATFVCAVSVFAQTTTFNFSGAIVNYTVPAGVTKITIVAKGAQGGNASSYAGGLGASMQGDFIVTPGQVLKILVGQKGGTNTNNAGGGGGSFVTTNTNSPLIVAGGGGGAFCSVNGLPGLITTGGTNGGGNSKQTADGGGGTNGGGGGGSANNNGAAAGGAGLLGNGGNGAYSSGFFCFPTGGGGGNATNGGNASGGAFCSGYYTTTQNSFINGGQSNTYGGFGGGGGVSSYYGCYISGGGGGYSGGGAGSANPGGGGGSYNNGTAQVNVAGAQSGNGVVTITPFPPATALNFDGTNDYVAVNNPFRTFNKEITVEFWMNTPSANMPYGCVMGQGTSNVDDQSTNVWLMHPNINGTMSFYVNDAGTWRSAQCNLIAGTWHHYAGVASATSTKIYVDGVLIAAGPGISNTILNNSNSVVHIGKDVRFDIGKPGDIPRYANMSIDEVRIWNRALCQDEIVNNMNCQTNSQTGLQELYHFNQGVVNSDNTGIATLTDASGNGRDGALTNFALTGTSSNWVASGSTNTGTCAAFVAPVAPITGTTSICLGSTTTLSNANAGGVWTSSNTSVATINASTGAVNSVGVGTSTITYTTECGAVSTAVLTVSSIPVFTVCPASKVTGNDAGQCNAVVSYSATTSGSPAPSLSYTFSGATTGSGSGTGSGQTFNVGVTTVTITATNTCGSASCSFTVTVTALDSDGDGIPDACDDDADNDGIPNAVECNKSNFFWSTPPTVSGKTATGTINGIGYTYTSSSPVTTTTSMFAHSNFPVSYGVPNANPTIQNIYVTNNTLTFASPMTNPVLVFASIGQAGLSVPISFSAPVQIVWSQNVVQNSSTQITGTEGYAIIRMMGTFSSISFNYLAAENYCNFAFGADFMTCGDTDGDGIPDYLDTDSDGDGCPDAIEGSMSFSMSQTSNARLIGGVNSRGIPLLAGNGQGLGTSQNYVANCFCQAGLDETKPIAVTKNITVNLDASGHAAITAAQVNNGSTDDCGIAGMTVSKTNFDCSNIGANTVTLSVTDNQGNVGTATATVTVQDVTPPTISCPANISIVAASAAGAVVTYVAPVGTDNCSGATTVLTAGLPGGSTFPLGTTTVTHTVTDGAGLSASCSFTVTVTGIAPSIACPSNITVNNDPGQCSAVVNFAATETTGVPASTITYSIPSGSTFALGTTTVTATATNAVGSSACTFTVTVKDVTPPTIVCAANVTVNADPNNCNANITVPKPAVSDNCGGTYPAAPFAPTNSNLMLWMDATRYSVTNGTNMNGILNDASGYNRSLTTNAIFETAGINGRPSVRYNNNRTVVNAPFPTNGNSFIYLAVQVVAAGSTWASILDHHNRDMGLALEQSGFKGSNVYHFQTGNDNSNVEQTLAFGTNYIMAVSITGGNLRSFTLYKDNNGVLQNLGTTTNNAFNIAIGNNHLYIGKSDANEYVNMRLGEFIYFQNSLPVTESSVVNYLYSKWFGNQITVTNSFNGTGDASGIYPVGNTNVTWTATDASGNASTCTQTVTVLDNQPPTITCAPNVNVIATSAAGAVVNYVAPVGTDNCSGTTTVLTAGLPSGSTFPIGTTTVTYTATDASGNSANCSFTVTVKGLPPVIVNPGNQTVSAEPGKCGAVVNYAATETTGIPASTITYSINPGSFFPVGTTAVTATATNAVGSSACTFNITVTDNENPTITAPAAISVNNDAGNCNAVVATLGTPATGDNCGVASITNDAPATFLVGTTTVTWTVTDIHGNSSTAAQTVTVTDNEKPSITAPAAISVNNDAGICGAVVALGTPITGDNCGVATTTNNAPATFPVGTTTVTWTVIDIHGNSNTATQTVTVTDNEKPTITAPATVSVSNDAGKCSAVVTLGTATTGDNCGVASTTNDAPAIFPVGTTTVTWTVTDIHGNSNTATQTVTVTDNEKPVIACAANQVFCANFGGVTTYSIPALSASDNCGIASTTYTVSGATNRSESGNDASGVFAVGVSTVTFTVTDVHNNVSTCSFTVTINPLPVATITASTADAFCNKLTLTGSSTLSGPFSYQWLYANSSFSTSNPVDLGLTNGDGVYSLYTTDANGCRSEFAATYNYQKQNLSSSYTIIAYKEAELGDYNTVASGSVGVLSAKGEAEFGRYSTVTSAGSFVKAVKIELEKYASVSQPIRAAATPVLPTMIYNTANTRSLPNYEVKGGTTVTLNGNYGNLNIKKGSVVTLTGTVFGTIHTEEGAQLTFTKSSISIDKLQLDKGPKTGYTYVHFAPNSQVLISRSVSIGDRIFLNPENNKVTFYVGTLQDNKKGDNDRDDEARFNVNGKDVKVTVNVMMPNGKLKVNGGDMGDDDSKKSATSYVYMTGLFVAAEVEGEGKHVIWNSFDCSAPSSSAVNASAFVSQSVGTKEETTVTTEEELKITVMPNPSTTHFTLKLESRYETPVNMRVMDASGRVIDSRSRIGSNSTIQIGHNYSSGIYYAEMIQGTKRKVVQLIKGNK